MTESTETFEEAEVNLDAAVQEALTDPLGEPKQSILKTWKFVLERLIDAIDDDATPGLALEILSAGFGQLKLSDVPAVQMKEQGLLQDALQSVTDALESDTFDETKLGKEDGEAHAELYAEVIAEWTALAENRHTSWCCTSPEAGIDLAVNARLENTLFSRTGLAAYLERIELNTDEHFRALLEEATEKLKQERAGE